MKALYCADCGDLVVLRYHGWRSCECGASRGCYVTRTPAPGESDARIEGVRAFVVGIANDEFEKAFTNMRRWPRVEGIGAYHDYDYYCVEMQFKSWFFGPNALASTRETPAPRELVNEATHG